MFGTGWFVHKKVRVHRRESGGRSVKLSVWWPPGWQRRAAEPEGGDDGAGGGRKSVTSQPASIEASVHQTLEGGADGQTSTGSPWNVRGPDRTRSWKVEGKKDVNSPFFTRPSIPPFRVERTDNFPVQSCPRTFHGREWTVKFISMSGLHEFRRAGRRTCRCRGRGRRRRSTARPWSSRPRL